GLGHEPGHPEADRGGLWLEQDHRRAGQAASSRPAQGRLAVHLRHGRLQPYPPAEAVGAGSRTMRRKSAFAAVFKGRWRIAEMDMLASGDLDLAEPAHISFSGPPDAHTAFRGLTAPLP